MVNVYEMTATDITEAIWAMRLNGGMSSSEERQRSGLGSTRIDREAHTSSYYRPAQQVNVSRRSDLDYSSNQYPYHRHSSSMDWKDAMYERCGR